MEVLRQKCQHCGSFETVNLLVRQPNEPTLVYVRCAKCDEFIARYILARYYHHGKGMESFLRFRGAEAMESGRRLLDEFKRAKEESLEGYEKVLEHLREQGEDL